MLVKDSKLLKKEAMIICLSRVRTIDKVEISSFKDSMLGIIEDRKTERIENIIICTNQELASALSIYDFTIYNLRIIAILQPYVECN
jgi:hypothetical protein